MPKVKERSSRRAPILKDDDYDHEIALVDHADGRSSSTQAPSPDPTTDVDSRTSRHLPSGTTAVSPDSRAEAENSDERRDETQLREDEQAGATTLAVAPEVAIQAPTPFNGPQVPSDHVSDLDIPHHPRLVKRPAPVTAIDVLYENQRGGFLCGMALFSSAALGNLDPPAWTNSFHKPSPTDPTTAQVPDPGWEWAWPEWHINMDDGVDENGWEYSFMFAKRFSWHGPAWWNSFVRRRAWTRERRRRPGGEEGVVDDGGNMLSTDYFTVRPSVDLERGSNAATHGRRGSHASMASSVAASVASSAVVKKSEDITNADDLLAILRRSRIDREKIEAVQNYVEYGQTGFEALAEHMHEIMGLFVFQASRRVFLSMLVSEITVPSSENGKANGKIDQLREAVKHAEEEIDKLEFWSDLKDVTEDESKSASEE